MDGLGVYYMLSESQRKTNSVYLLCVKSKYYNKLVNLTKKKQNNSYRVQTSSYQSREEQYRGRGLKDTNYKV